MSCANWFRFGLLATLLFALSACGQKENLPPPTNEEKPPELAVDKKADVATPREAAVDGYEVASLRHKIEIKDGLQGQSSALALDLSKSQTLTLSGANTYTGATISTNSVINAQPALSIPPVQFSDIRPIVLATSTRETLTLSGAANITKFGAGTLTLTTGTVTFGLADGTGKEGAGGFNFDPLAPGDNRNRDGEHIGSTENYERIFDNPYKLVKHDPLSTISSAVDTASYSNVRGRMNAGQLPPKDAVRIADMLNYFNYDYAGPKNDEPVAFSLEIAPCPWQPKHHLLRIGLKAKTIDKENMPARNLTFLIDTSGSMSPPNRLPLVKESLKLLVNQLTDKDVVSIVTYAGNAGVALPPTPGSEKATILKAIDSFDARGSTNGEGGLKAAYEQAKAGFIKDGLNRVILATDGDFNVGISSDAEMVRLIEEKRDTGVYLTVLGYGMGNLKDSKLEQLAHHGNGHYAYIDSLDEAKKVFVEQGGSLVTVAKDVKLQVEFNPAKVAGYRLIGYENRVLRNEDFRNDKKDAGDMGSGHMCTALYEIVPAGEKVNVGEVEPLKYQTTSKLSEASKSGEWATVRMRYKDPTSEKAQEVAAPLTGDALAKKVSNDFEFAACVASFGMLLRDWEFKGNATYAATLETAEGLLRDKKDQHREEFVKLVRVALTLEQAKK